MATVTEVEKALDEIAHIIPTSRQNLVAARVQFQTQATNLGALPTRYADMIATVNAYPADGTMFEQMMKAKLAAYVAEYTPLLGEANTVVAGLVSLGLEEF